MIYYKDGAKMMRPVLTREEYLSLRNGGEQRAIVKAVRAGDETQKRRLVQMNYSCLPNEDGTLKGSTKMSDTVGMDIDHVAPEEMPKVKERILAKKDELGLRMLELSARGKGYHLVFSRRPYMSNEENLQWASQLLQVAYDAGAKDITRVFFTTTGSEEDLIYLDDEIFGLSPMPLPVREGSGQTQGQKVSTPLPHREGTGESLSFKDIPYSSIISSWWQKNGGEPQEGERNVKLYQLASNLRAICDNRKEVLMAVMPRLGLSEQELQSIVDSACKEPPKGISKQLRAVLDARAKELSTPLPHREGAG